jgi:hypothetical protein
LTSRGCPNFIEKVRKEGLGFLERNRMAAGDRQHSIPEGFNLNHFAKVRNVCGNPLPRECNDGRRNGFVLESTLSQNCRQNFSNVLHVCMILQIG